MAYDDYEYEEAPGDWWQSEENFAKQYGSYEPPDYSLSSFGSGEGLQYQTSPDNLDLAEPSNQGSGLNASDYAYVPGAGFVYTRGGGDGSGMSFGSTGSGAYAGMPTSVSATSTGSGRAPSSSGLFAGIKSLPSALKSALNQAGTSDWADLLKMLLVMNQLKEGKKIGGYQGGIDMNRRVVGGQEIPQQARAYGEAAQGQSYFTPVTYAAEGGVMGLANGGQAKPPRYLDGETDGMADKINTDIDGKQAAKLSHGEFVIPADVVSHLGNGNSSAGAKVLYKMMDRVRKARTGNKKQGKQIRPEKFMPGGIAGYEDGGAVAFAAGGATTQTVPATNTAPNTSTESNLSSWAGPYVTNYLSKANALAEKPYVAYTGELSAGTSPLQQQAMTGLSSQKAYTPTTFDNQYKAPAAYAPTAFDNQYKAPSEYKAAEFNTGLGNVGSVQDYMNPYLQNVTNIQAAEARRQSDISRLADASRLTQAGAYGGSRQAIMEAEARRNLGTQIGSIQATGLQNAYDAALKQRLNESNAAINAQQLKEQSRQFGANQGMTSAQLAAQYGLSSLQAAEQAKQFGANQAMTAAQQAAQYGLAGQQAAEESKQFASKQGLALLGEQMAAGNVQRTIQQQANDARKAQFDAQQADPYRKLQFLQSMINGLPISTDTSSANTTTSQDLAKAIADILALSKP